MSARGKLFVNGFKKASRLCLGHGMGSLTVTSEMIPYSSHSCFESNEEHRCSVHSLDLGEESPSRSWECAVHLSTNEYGTRPGKSLLTLGTTLIQYLKVTLVLDNPRCMAQESR